MANWWDSAPLADAAPSPSPQPQPQPQQPASNWWESAPVVSAESPSEPATTGGGIAQAFGSGVAKGAAMLAGLPGDIGNLYARGGDILTQYLGERLGMSPEDMAEMQRAIDTGRQHSAMRGLPTSQDARAGIESVTGPLYEPQTQAEKYVGSVGEFVPSALAGPGSVARKVLGYGVAPGVASELAGQMTEGATFMGYDVEPVARTGAAVIAGGAAGVGLRPSTPQAALRSQLSEGVTPQAVSQAERLISDAQARGVTLTWPEALEQVRPGSGLTNMQRTLEAAPDSRGAMEAVLARRPAQIDAAARDSFARVADSTPSPSSIGPEAGRVAQDVTDDVREAINAKARPFYDAAGPQLIDRKTFANIRRIPAFNAALREVRNDPILGPTIKGLPDNSVAVIDAVKKHVDAMEAAALNPSAPHRFRASELQSGRRKMVEAADHATGSNPQTGAMGSYETARYIGSEGRRRFLDPLLNGPLGKIAGKDTTTRKAIDALFPANPLPGSEDEIATAVAALTKRRPQVARQLVRAHLESAFNEASQNLQSGANQFGGAKFAAVVAGNPQQRANVKAAIEALPNGKELWSGFNRLLDVMEATGKRQGVGSKTAYNTQELADMSKGGMVSGAAKLAASPGRVLTVIGEKWSRWQLGNNLEELAAIITDPKAGPLLRQIAKAPTDSQSAGILAARLLNMGQIANYQGNRPAQEPK